MKAPSVWSKPGRWFKGNLHIHTANSDGARSLLETAAQYETAGYDFIAVTDHNLVSDVSKISSSKFLALPGVEITAGETAAGVEIHILGIGVHEFVRSSPQDAIDAVNAAGGVALVAHPWWSGMSSGELSRLQGFCGLEVFNSSCEFSIGKGRSDLLWDGLLATGRTVYGFANDDCHNHFNDHRPLDAAVAWLSLKAETLSEEGVLAALKAGDFYSSWGPEIKDFRIEDGFAHVECSPAKRIVLHADAACGEAFFAKEGLLEAASCKLRGRETFFRAEVVDELGRTAWTNPIFI